MVMNSNKCEDFIPPFFPHKKKKTTPVLNSSLPKTPPCFFSKRHFKAKTSLSQNALQMLL